MDLERPFYQVRVQDVAISGVNNPNRDKLPDGNCFAFVPT